MVAECPVERMADEPPVDEARVDRHADHAFPHETAAVAEQIGFAALALAKEANRAGLTTLGFLLESAALEAGAEAASHCRTAEAADN